jgi:hypothetical protein
VETGAYVTVAGQTSPPDGPNQSFKLQTAAGEALPILKENFLTLTLGRRPRKIRVFVADITNELILGLDILRACDASVDSWRQMLRLAEESSSLVMTKDYKTPARCEGIVVARLENLLGV